MTYEQLEQKIKLMTAKEIILAMVDSLKNPVTKVLMSTFGFKENGICYGCAATNTICKLGGLDPYIELGEWDIKRRKYVNNSIFLNYFEEAIDFLRQGNIENYNEIARLGKFAEIKDVRYHLPSITDDNYQNEDVFNGYIKLANLQEEL